MKYLLRKVGLAIMPEVEITEHEYAEYEKARNILSNALAIEEKYEILISNYLDFEKEMLSCSAEHMIRERIEYSVHFQVRLSLNTRLVNLLTAAKMYVDQLGQHVRECLPAVPDAIESVKQLLSKEYDGNKEYRFMEALRNYVQHRGTPVHWTQLGSRWTPSPGDGFLEYSTELASQLQYLKRDRAFKKSVLEELEGDVDLKASTRSYVESISIIHETARTMIFERVASARALIEDAHSRYSDVFDGSLVGLSAIKRSSEGRDSEIPLLLEWDDIRVKLAERNKKIINLGKRYVTGRVKAHKTESL